MLSGALRPQYVRNIIGIAVRGGAALGLSLIILSFLFPLPSPKPYSLLVEDRNGQFLQAFLTPDDKWRLKTSSEEIPAKLKYILTKKEDRFFYYHPGINPFSIVRALVQNAVAGKKISGASTITMQVARMIEPKERTYFNKLIEMFRAIQLELHYSKDEILTMYLSNVPLGGNIEGLKSASYIYYQTPVERLNIAQLLDLILIPNNPNTLRPDRHPDALLAARIHLAAPWIRKKFLSREDSLIICQTRAAANRTSLPSYAPHFCSRIKDEFRQSAEVRSSLELRIQKIAETQLSAHLREWRQRGVQNGAMLVVNNRTRNILAYVGSENFEDQFTHGQVDAVKALRSPGSTLKPLLYALEMEKGTLTPKTRLLDTPYDAEGFSAENYDGKYSGYVFADVALRHSLNVPMIRLLHSAGTKSFIEFLHKVGFRSLELQEDRLGLSMIVGGCGVTLEELVGAYSAFPSGGLYAPLSYIQSPAAEAKQTQRVFSKATAFMVTEILSGLDRPDIPNNFESSLNLPTVAFKTGTSYGRRDAWAVGYSAEFTVGVWLGNVTNKGSADLVSRESSAPLLIDMFNSISSTHQKEILPEPEDLMKRQVCANSGLLPNRCCTHLIEDYYSVLRTQGRVCDIDKEIMVSTDGSMSFCPSCLSNNSYRLVRCEDYPADLLMFWDNIGRKHKSLPPHNPACTRVFTGDGPRIVSPSDNMIYYIVSDEQRLSLQACSPLDVHLQIWYLDDQFLCKLRPPEKYFLTLKQGEHSMTCVDDKGRMSSVKFQVRSTI